MRLGDGIPLGFKDYLALGNRPDCWLVEFYYRHSPPIADYIRDRKALKAIVRAVLTPVVYAIEYPLAALLLLLLPVLLLARKRMRRPAVREMPGQ